MSDCVIVYKNDITVSIIVPSLGMNVLDLLHLIPDQKQYLIVEKNKLPVINIFRDAWDIDFVNKEVFINLEKAKEISHQLRKYQREQEFEPYDNIIMKQLPGYNFNEIESKRQLIRDKYYNIQNNIDSVLNIEELNNIISIFKLESN
jgi:hypothetical protein